MTLSLKLRNEENERISNILNNLIELVFVPEDWQKGDVQRLLAKLGLSYDSLDAMTGTEFTEHITKFHFDFANMERFANILAKNPFFKEKTIALYNFIQTENKMFSLDIFNKINSLNK